MEKTLLLLALTLLLTTSTFAQSDYSIGFSVGAGLTSFRGDNFPDNADANIEPIFGVNVEKQMENGTFFRSGLSYGNKSVDIPNIFFDSNDPSDPRFDSTVDVSISTLTVPLHFGYKGSGDLAFVVSGGPFFSYILNSENILSKKLDFGIGAAIGAEYKIGVSNALRLELTEELGLGDIGNSRLNPTAIKTNRIGINLSYILNL